MVSKQTERKWSARISIQRLFEKLVASAVTECVLVPRGRRRAEPHRSVEGLWDPICSRSPSFSSQVIAVGRTGSRNVVGNLSPCGVRPGQCCGEGDASSGDLCARRVSMGERGDNRDVRDADPPDGGDERQLRVRATVNDDGLTVAKTNRTGDRDNRRAHLGGGNHTRATCRANRCDDGVLEFRARIDHELLAWVEAFDARNTQRPRHLPN